MARRGETRRHIPEKFKLRGLEKFIAKISPKWAYKRSRYRNAAEMWDQFTSYRHSVASRLHRSRGDLSGSADVHLDRTEREDLMNRCRDLGRNNAVAKGMLDRSCDNVVSTGIMPQAQSGDDDWNDEAEERFHVWAEEYSDVRGQLSFWDFQKLAYRSKKRDGDVGFVLAGKQLQAIEAERIVTPYDLASDRKIEQGVEMDSAGRPRKYWVADYAPYGGWINSANAQPVQAQNFIHLYSPERLSQTRGCPVWAPCLGYFQQLDQYIEAELTGAQMTAMFSVIITGDQRMEPWAEMQETDQDAADEDQGVIDVEPGGIYNFSGIPGGKAWVVDPKKPPRQFPDFVTAILRFLGLPLGLPLELVALDFQKASYASGRLAMLQAYRTCRVEQMMLIRQFCKRVWRWKISQFMKHGGPRPDDRPLKKPKGRNSDAWRHIWQPPGWEWIDPESETKANALALDRGMITLAEIAQEKGMDAKDLLEARAGEIAKSMELAEKIGLGKEKWREIARADTKRTKGSGDASAETEEG